MGLTQQRPRGLRVAISVMEHGIFDSFDPVLNGPLAMRDDDRHSDLQDTMYDTNRQVIFF